MVALRGIVLTHKEIVWLHFEELCLRVETGFVALRGIVLTRRESFGNALSNHTYTYKYFTNTLRDFTNTLRDFSNT